MTISEALSDRGIYASIDACKIGRERLGKEFYSSCVKRLTKNGFSAEVQDKSGNKYNLKAKSDLTVISFEKV